MSRFRLLTALAVAVAVILAAALWIRPRIEAVEVGVDDANIFFVFARNLANGHGFVWNVGGPRVEGFSSPLWLLVMTPFFFFSQGPEYGLFLMSVLFLGAGLAVFLALLSRPFDTSIAARSPVSRLLQAIPSALWILWWIAQPMFVLWTTLTLMETGLWCAVALLATAAASWGGRTNRDAPPWLLWAAVPCVLLARPEGMMWAGILIAAGAAAQWLRGQPFRMWMRYTVGSLAIYAIALASITMVRLAYFGYPLPNTYYAKVSPDRLYTLQTGWSYFTEFAQSHRLLPFLIGIACATAIAFVILVCVELRARLRGIARAGRAPAPDIIMAFATAAASLAGLAAPILVGGDHFDGFRFYQPIWPLLPLPALFLLRAGLARIGRMAPLIRTRAASTAFAAVLLVALGALVAPQPQEWAAVGRRRVVDEFRLARDGRILGETLNRIFADDYPEVGAIAVGGVQFSYRGWINDLMGLSNIEMAHHPGERKGIKNHAAFSKQIFFKQQPPVMVPAAFHFRARDFQSHPMPPDFHKYLNQRWVVEPLQGLPRDPAFRARYTPALVSRAKAADAECIGAFFRNDFLASLETNAIYEVAAFPL